MSVSVIALFLVFTERFLTILTRKKTNQKLKVYNIVLDVKTTSYKSNCNSKNNQFRALTAKNLNEDEKLEVFKSKAHAMDWG